jgi:peptidyl-prolyl cis-trans isomerase SurA
MRLRLLTAASICLTFAGTLRAADIMIIDEIIAKVNGDIVTRNDLDRGKKQLEGTLRQQGLTGPRLAEAIKTGEGNILRERIDQLLLLSKGKELNINVDAEVNKQLAEIQRSSKIADPEKFQAFVKEQTGQSYEDYKGELKNQAITNRIIRQEVAGRIQFKREEQLKYYEDHKSEFQRQERVFLREILVNGTAADSAAAEKKAKDLSARARKGEKFDELAQTNSDSPTQSQGGDIGAFDKGQLRPEMEKLVWDQPRGYVTDPINVGTGFLILKVDEHPKAGLAEFEEVQQEISGKLFQPRFQPELRKYLTTLRQNAFLEIKPGYEDSAAAPGKDTKWVDPAEIRPETITKEAVLMKMRRKKLLGMVPIPGTTLDNTGTSSSRK